MFEDVTRRDRTRLAGRRLASLLLSTALQAGLVVLLALAGRQLHAAATEAPVQVLFPRAPSPAPATPPAARRARPRPAGVTRASPPPAALVQPREVPPDLPPAPTDPPEEVGAGTGEGGVIGGAVGLPSAPGPTGPALEEAPAYVTGGYVRPRLDQACIQRGLRLGEELVGSGARLTVKFAVDRDGRPSLFEVLSGPVDPRLARAVWSAVRSCQHEPGADAQGRATRLWVILPLRLAE